MTTVAVAGLMPSLSSVIETGTTAFYYDLPEEVQSKLGINSIEELNKKVNEMIKVNRREVRLFKSKILKALNNYDTNKMIDPDEQIVDFLRDKENQFKRSDEMLRGIADNVDSLRKSRSRHVKLLVETYDNLRDLCLYVVSTYQDLRWKILIRDGALDKKTGSPISSGEEFIRNLEGTYHESPIQSA